MDDKSTTTSLSSYKTEQDEKWCGQLPCVSYNSHKGCHQHNSTRLPIYRNPLLSPKEHALNYFTRFLKSFWLNLLNKSWPYGELKAVSVEDPEPTPPFYTDLPLDCQSIDTLAPMHPTMPYHLAFYHLHCIREQLDPSVKIAFIPELSCGGISQFSPNGPKYKWSSEIYFENGTFLQKQEIDYLINEDSYCPSLRFTGCPHINFRILAPRFKEVDGFLVARTLLLFTPIGGREVFGIKWWTSKLGRFARMNPCAICLSDHEYILEVIGRQLRIRITYYRDLGNATERSLPKWVGLLTGEGLVVRHYVTFDLYARVWKAAQQLGRPNLHVVTHQSKREGDFVVKTT